MGKNRALGDGHGPGQVESKSADSGLFGRGMLYAVVLSAQVLTSILISPILAHLLPMSEFGSLASAISLYQVLSAIAVLGMDRAIVVRRGVDGDSGGSRFLLSISFFLSLAVSIVVFATMFWWAPLAGFGHHYVLTTAVLLWTLPSAFVQCASALLLSEDRIRAFTTVTLVSTVAGPVIGLALILFCGSSANVYAMGAVVAQFAGAALAAILARPTFCRQVSRGTVRSALQLGLPLSASGLAYFVLNAGDRIMIQRELGPAAVGRYQVAYVVGSMVLLLLGFLNTAWSPRIIAVRDRAQRLALSLRSRDTVYGALLPVVGGIGLGAPIALRVVVPESYEPASLLPVVLIVAFSAFPAVSAGATQRMLLADSRGGVLALAAAASAVVNVLLNLAFIPWLGLLGSAVATLVAYVVLALVQRVAIGQRDRWPRPPFRVVFSAAAVVILSTLMLLVPQNDLFDNVRLVGALACVAWLVVIMRRIRADV